MSFISSERELRSTRSHLDTAAPNLLYHHLIEFMEFQFPRRTFQFAARVATRLVGSKYAPTPVHLTPPRRTVRGPTGRGARQRQVLQRPGISGLEARLAPPAHPLQEQVEVAVQTPAEPGVVIDHDRQAADSGDRDLLEFSPCCGGEGALPDDLGVPPDAREHLGSRLLGGCQQGGDTGRKWAGKNDLVGFYMIVNDHSKLRGDGEDLM